MASPITGAQAAETATRAAAKLQAALDPRLAENDDDDEEDRETAELAEALMQQVRVSAAAAQPGGPSGAQRSKQPQPHDSHDDNKRVQSSGSRARLDIRQRPRGAATNARRRPETRDFTFDIIERKRIERENHQLVKKLASINNRRQGAAVAAPRQTAAAPRSAPRAGSAQINNRRHQKAIDRENEAFAKRLAKVRGTLHFAASASTKRR